MSEQEGTTFIVKKHLSKWQIAYIKWFCLCLSADFTYIHAELKGYANFSDISLISWFEMAIWTISLTATTTIAFLDKSHANGESEKKGTVQ